MKTYQPWSPPSLSNFYKHLAGFVWSQVDWARAPTVKKFSQDTDREAFCLRAQQKASDKADTCQNQSVLGLSPRVRPEKVAFEKLEYRNRQIRRKTAGCRSVVSRLMLTCLRGIPLFCM